MANLILEVKQLKKGFNYTVKDGDTIIDTRNSNRAYVAASLYFHPSTPDKYLRPLYHSRMDLIGKGDGARYAKNGYQCKVATIKE